MVLVFAALAGTGASRAAGQTKEGTPTPRGASTPPRVKVRVSQPLVREVTDYVILRGHIEAAVRVEFRPRVSGTLNTAACVPGQEVKKGELVFEVDPRPYQAERDKAEAEVERAQTRQKRLLSDLARVKELAKTGTVSQPGVSRVEGEVLEAHAAVKAARAARDLAALTLGYTQVRAPIDGTIIGPVLAAGNVVVADKTPLATMISTDPMYVYFDVDQPTVLKLDRLRREGKLKGGAGSATSVGVGLEGEDGFPRSGKITSVNAPFDPATVKARWRAVLPNPDRLLLPGMAAQVRLATSTPYKALLVPYTSPPFHLTNTWIMYVVTDQGVIEKRVVKLGSQQGDLWAVKEGIRAEEWLLTGWDAPGSFPEEGLKLHFPRGVSLKRPGE
jgi:RND family efflux transporter MFP subunit